MVKRKLRFSSFVLAIVMLLSAIKARLRNSLQARQKSCKSGASKALRRQAPFAEGLQGSEPHRRGQGRVCSLLDVRRRRRRKHPLQGDPCALLERQQLRLYGNQLLLGCAGRNYRFRTRSRGRLLQNAGRLNGIH